MANYKLNRKSIICFLSKVFKNAGYDTIEIWEHDLNQEKVKNILVQRHIT